jgi:hypothetical protein
MGARSFGRLFTFLTIPLVFAVGCASETTADSDDSEGAEADLTETRTALNDEQKRELTNVGFAPDEIQAVAESIAISKVLGVQSFVSEANDGNAKTDHSIRRESHGKHQGCLRAKFEVTGQSLNTGVFKTGATYPTWVRLSNGGAYQKSDGSQHISRGWGVKLLGVDGAPSGTQDFLFITSPRFFIHDIKHYPGFLKNSGNGRLGFFANLLFNMSWEEKQVIFHRLSLKVSNLLESPEYSAVPYSFGDETVKYALAPCGSQPPSSPESKPPPRGASDNYLEEAMNSTLASSSGDAGVCYSFFIQRPRNANDDPTDNPTKAWEGAFTEVAKITIPKGQEQGGTADYRSNEDECERMAFDPFNTTSASTPRGKTNWTRKFVYAALNKFRRVDMPAIYAKWQANHDDASIPIEYRKELRKLRDPNALAPKVKTTTEPTVDEGFRKLGIVSN